MFGPVVASQLPDDLEGRVGQTKESPLFRFDNGAKVSHKQRIKYYSP